MEYAYQHFKRELRFVDMAWRGGPRPGDELRPSDHRRCPAAQGRLRGVRPLLLTFGSVTCPVTADADPKLKHLHQRDGGRVAFATLYVREAHPGDRYPQPDTSERKMQFARALGQRAGRSPLSERSGRLAPMMRGLAHVDKMLERSGAAARRDLLRQASPMYAMARIAGLARRSERAGA
jgi:hypothetical protein